MGAGGDKPRGEQGRRLQEEGRNLPLRKDVVALEAFVFLRPKKGELYSGIFLVFKDKVMLL